MSAAQTTRRAPKRPAATEPAGEDLGEVRFEDWFETPMFETGPDERLEQLATSRRGPLRAAASALLRMGAFRPARRQAVPPDGAPDGSEKRRRHVPAHTAGRPRTGWRSRAGRALDAWAEREATGAERLERMLLPARWRS